MISNQVLRDWLGTGLAKPTQGFPGPDLQNIPDRYFVLTWTGGPGLALEYVLDRPSFQIRAIGEQGSYDDAEALAFELDSKLLAGPWPATIGGTRVVGLTRAGGPPTALPQNDADQTSFTCSYIIEVASGL